MEVGVVLLSSSRVESNSNNLINLPFVCFSHDKELFRKQSVRLTWTWLQVLPASQRNKPQNSDNQLFLYQFMAACKGEEGSSKRLTSLHVMLRRWAGSPRE